MSELNVTASAHFHEDGQHVVHVLLKVMVSNENGAGRKDLALADFKVQAMDSVANLVNVDVTAVSGEVELGKSLSDVPRGFYLLNVYTSDGVSFDVNVPWTVIIHVDRWRYLFHYEGWAVVAVNSRSTLTY